MEMAQQSIVSVARVQELIDAAHEDQWFFSDMEIEWQGQNDVKASAAAGNQEKARFALFHLQQALGALDGGYVDADWFSTK